MAFAEYDAFDATGLADLVRRREVSAADLVDEAIRRAEAIDPSLHFLVHRRFERARAEATQVGTDGPFVGVPFLLKDLLAALAGEPMSSGSRLLRGTVSAESSSLVRRYLAAGVIVLGKTSTPELGIYPTTEPEAFGPTRNPWDPARTPGGSSGGSAAAVAAGIVPIASGGDGGGSIRIPASCCGLFGLKPSRGRTPQGPETHLWAGGVVEHVLTRTVRDSARMLDATAGPDAGAPYAAPPPERPFAAEVSREPGRLRISVTTTPFLPGAVHPDCVRAVEEAARLLEELGHEVQEGAPRVDPAAFARCFLLMVVGETEATLREVAAARGRAVRREEVEHATWLLASLARVVPAGDHAYALKRLYAMAREASAFFDGCDVLLTPTLAQPPPLLGTLGPGRLERVAMELVHRMRGLRVGRLFYDLGGLDRLAESVYAFMPFTPLFNVTGQPSMSVPLAASEDGMPVGVMLTAKLNDEATLFRLAGQLERARPWSDRRPQIHAQDLPAPGRSD